MIFITVGTHTQSFNRLLEKMDELIEKKKIREEVVAQIGHSTYEPKKMRWFRFTDFDELNKLYKDSRIIIAHGGAGSILNGLSNSTPVVAVPRYKKFDEHVNDHQLELVRKMEEVGKVTAVYNIDNLYDAISKASKTQKIKTETKICEEIDKFLKEKF